MSARTPARRRFWAAAGVTVALAVAALAIDAQVPSAGEQLAQPVRVGAGELVAVEPLRAEVRAGDPLVVRLRFRGRVPSQDELSLRVTPIGFDAYSEPAPEPERTSFGSDALRATEVTVEVPPFFRPGAYTFRLLGREPTFGHVEIVGGDEQ